MSYLRRLSTRSLIVLVVAVLALAGGGAAIAVAAGGGGPTPAPKPLDQAIHDALHAPSPRRRDGAHRVHEQAVPVRRAPRRPGRLRADLGRLRPPVGDRRRDAAGSSCSPTPATSRSSGTPRRSPSTTHRRTPSTALRCRRARLRRAGSRTRRRRSPRSTRSSPTSAFTGRSPLPARWTSRVSPRTAPRSRRSTTAACSARSSSPGTRSQGTPLRAGIYAQGASSPALELTVTRHLLRCGSGE